MLRIASPKIINHIFSTGIDAPTNEVAFGAFQLLVGICNNCDENKELIEIIDFLKSKSHALSQYITSNKSFTKDKRAACELLNLIISTSQTISQEILDTILFLFDLFFEYPTNSFLHQVFLSIVQSLTCLNTDFAEFSTKLQLVNKLLDIEKKRGTIMASFWGHCTQIELILKDKIKENEEWDKYVNDTLIPRDQIIKSNYGGEVPK